MFKHSLAFEKQTRQSVLNVDSSKTEALLKIETYDFYSVDFADTGEKT